VRQDWTALDSAGETATFRFQNRAAAQSRLCEDQDCAEAEARRTSPRCKTSRRQVPLPQGSHLKGSVLQVRPARRLERNGQLRIVFHQVVPPGGIEQRVEASLEGVDVAKGEHLSLDSEGGAQVTSPRTRYLSTGISVMLASS